jgi:hypothetical protein
MVKPADPCSEKCSEMFNGARVVEDNLLVSLSRGAKITLLRTLLNEKRNFSYKLVKLSFKLFSKFKFTAPLRSPPWTSKGSVDPRLNTADLEARNACQTMRASWRRHM